MSDRLKLIWSVVKAAWWVLILIVAAVLIGWIIVVKTRGKKVTGSSDGTIVGEVASKVSDAVTEVRIDRAVIKAESDAKREELRVIREEPDGKKRRERLAGILEKSL